ncbi:MAG: signal peptidase I [Candidatus Zipacnadales bacterium]
MTADRSSGTLSAPEQLSHDGPFLRKGHRHPLWVDLVAVGGLVAAIVFLYVRVVRVAYVYSGSMRPTINPGDRVLIFLGAYRNRTPQHGDIVAFWAEDAGDYEVKRVIGVGGDTIVTGLGLVFRNGKRLDEPYIADPMIPEELSETKVPQGELFLMGDNRNGSEDSRDYGPIREDQVLGKVFFRILPVGRIGRVK